MGNHKITVELHFIRSKLFIDVTHTYKILTNKPLPEYPVCDVSDPGQKKNLSNSVNTV